MAAEHPRRLLLLLVLLAVAVQMTMLLRATMQPLPLLLFYIARRLLSIDATAPVVCGQPTRLHAATY